MNILRSMVIPDSYRTLANNIADMFAGSPQNMWNFPLSSTGQMPVTHWIAAGPVSAAYEQVAPWQIWKQDQEGQWTIIDSYAGQPEQVWAACQTADPPVETTLKDISDLFSAADVTDQDPWLVMSRLNLKPCIVEDTL